HGDERGVPPHAGVLPHAVPERAAAGLRARHGHPERPRLPVVPARLVDPPERRNVVAELVRAPGDLARVVADHGSVPGIVAVVRRADAADPEPQAGRTVRACPATRGRGVGRGTEPTVPGTRDVDPDLLGRDVRAVDPVLGRAAPGPELLVLGMET